MCRWMTRFASRFAVFLGRLAVFVLASEGRRLPRRGPFQFFGALLQLLDEQAKALRVKTYRPNPVRQAATTAVCLAGRLLYAVVMVLKRSLLLCW